MDSTAQEKFSITAFLYKLLPVLIPVVVIVFSSLVLIGWLLDLPLLTRLIPIFPAMNPFTALSFIMLSLSLLFLSVKKWNSIFEYLSAFLAVLVLVMVTAHISQLLFFGESVVDLFIFKDKILDPSQPPSRTALSTAVSFLLLGFSFLLVPLARYFKSSILNQFLTIGVLMISGIAFIFYIIKDVAFFEIPFFFSMAFHTVISFLLLSIAFLIFIQQRLHEKLIISDLKIVIAVLALFLPIWFGYISPEITKISNDFSYKADIFSTDNFYIEEEKAFSGEVLSNTIFSYKVVGKKDGVLSIENIFDVRQPTGEKIFSVDRMYGINAKTGEHVPGYGDKDRTGYLFGPKNATKEDFTYWHINYDEPAQMIFSAEEDVLGLKTYKYEADYTADQTNDLTYLPEVGKTRGVNLDIHLELWIEPTTGRMIKYSDATTAYYYDLSTGERIAPWNSFSNKFTTPSIEDQVFLAQQQIQTQFFALYIVPGSILLILVYFLIAFFINIFSDSGSFNFIPALTFIVGVSLTLLAWYLAIQNTNNAIKTKFDTDVEDITELITSTIDSYDLALLSTRGLLQASNEVSRSEWKEYISSLNLPLNFTGVQGIGYAVVINPEELDQHISSVRAEGFPDYTVRPLDEERDVYTSIIFLEPFDERNKRAFGFDMFSEEIRREGMSRARDTGNTAISGRVVLLQETDEGVQPGFLMYTPFYKNDTTVVTTSEKQENIAGYVYSAFRTFDLMKSIFVNTKFDINLEILDSEGDSLTYDNNGLYRSSLSDFEDTDIGSYVPRFTTSKVIELYGERWTLNFKTEPDFKVNPLQEKSATILLIGGSIFTIMVTYASHLLITSRARAVALADEITHDLKNKTVLLNESNKVLSKEVDERKKAEQVLEKKTEDLERINKLMVGRELKMVELKKKLEGETK